MPTVNEIVLRVVVRDGENATRVIREIGNATNGMADITRQNARSTREGLDSISQQLASTRQEVIAAATSFLGLSAITHAGGYAIAAATSFESLQARLKTMTGVLKCSPRLWG
ncbi:MAG: hypothetical protein QJT81_14005 [Candidatus Thiothrix putei]|uniref:Uncharacterized protein n=1 Tax=Candidatus Thiothrix putei TaxID=3080811 RepID=A0AA95HDP2_9GAMM|nr:MAG: hypothetical protein QJT81_14005 [Candidatus Thiothrix putei]